MLNYLKIRITLAGTPLVALEGGGVCEKFKMFFLGGGAGGRSQEGGNTFPKYSNKPSKTYKQLQFKGEP